MEVVIMAVAAPVIVGLFAWILKELYDLKGDRGRDSERWKQNQADHDRAFDAIDELKAGQRDILTKLDALGGKQ